MILRARVLERRGKEEEEEEVSILRKRTEKCANSGVMIGGVSRSVEGGKRIFILIDCYSIENNIFVCTEEYMKNYKSCCFF